MPYVLLHESGLTYNLEYSDGDAVLVDSTITLVSGAPYVGTTDSTDYHWAIAFDADQGDVQARITVLVAPSPSSAGTEYALRSATNSAIATDDGGSPYDLLAVPYFEFNTPFIGFFGGEGTLGAESQYLVEVFVDDVAPCFWTDAVGATHSCTPDP